MSPTRRDLLQTSFGLAAAGLLLPGSAWSQLRVEIFGVGASQIPVAIAPFAVGNASAAADSLQAELVQVVRSDLASSGLFRLIDVGNPNPALTDTSAVDATGWKQRGTDALVSGTLQTLVDGRHDVRFRLYDTVKNLSLGGLSLSAPREDIRLTAHRIADFVYEKLTGERGVFSTRIAYVVKQGSRYQLQVSDADGQNPQVALESREPIISPAWSPDGRRLAYVSFETRKPVVYVHTLANAQRQTIANFKGSNSSPAWSPDGSQLAVVLTQSGLSQIWLLAADGSGAPRRLTQSSGIDTEPAFSPDGKSIFFTSDRGGSPQIYRMPAGGGEAQRVTFNGAYNISAQPSPDGRLLAFVTRRGNAYQVAMRDLDSGQEMVLTDTIRDESPSFAPNGRQILYATTVGGRDTLAAVSIDGRVRQRLSGPAGDIREPTWGPFSRQ